MDPVKILPTEAFEKILSYLDINQLMSCCLVSQKWNIAANNDILWKEFCLSNDWSDCGKLKDYASCFQFLSPDKKDAFDSMGEWKKHFVLKMQIQRNWRTGNLVDYKLNPTEDENAAVTSATSDGNIVVFGLSNGTVKLYDLNQSCSRIVVLKDCPYLTPIRLVKIFQNFLFVVQSNLLLIFKITSNALELHCIKSVSRSSIINIDISTLPEYKDQIQELCYEEDIIIMHLDENNFIIGTELSDTLNIYSLKSDLIEPDTTIDLNLTDSRHVVSTIYVEKDKLYALVGVYSNEKDYGSIHELLRLTIHVYSLRNKALFYSVNMIRVSIPLHALRESVIEVNDCYLLVKFKFGYFYLFEKLTGRLLINETGSIFLNANSTTNLIAITLDDTFQITDPSCGDECFCLTLDGIPLAMYSSVVVTMSTEYNSLAVGSTEIEFWNLYQEIERVYDLKFPKVYDVSLIFNDYTKLIFHSKDFCLVRSYLV